MRDNQDKTRQPVVHAPGEGRIYRMPAMRAVFKADGEETANRYSVSEWWLEPGSNGPSVHSHEANDEIFFVIEGTPSLLLGDEWIDAPVGSCIIIPAGVTHDFANRTQVLAGLFNVFLTFVMPRFGPFSGAMKPVPSIGFGILMLMLTAIFVTAARLCRSLSERFADVEQEFENPRI